jgi:predicted DNA-binding protein (MmcQ/YjbR family)
MQPGKALRQAALRHPETEEGVACEGTPLEKRTVKVKGKAFLFLGATDAMVKLDASRAEAKRLGLKVGSGGWVKVTFDGATKVETLKKWIDESYRLMAPKRR